jgi:hypothetical protein
VAEDPVRHRILLFAALIICGSMATFAHAQVDHNAPAQHFICNTGFTVAECHTRMSVLKPILNRYHAEELGEWSWVLVRTRDLEQILSLRGFDSGIPAFTYLSANETFFDDALTARESIRGIELMKIWQMSMEELLDKAVRHELAHAFCKEKDEAKARALEERFRTQAPLSCGSPRQIN